MTLKEDPAFEIVVGLETHVELRTTTKAFCGCANRFGAERSSLCCPVCMGLPGALPVFNQDALRLSVLAGVALHCRINPRSHFDRKHYFYPDLPKAYQITQFDSPLCENGYLDIPAPGGEKRIRITRIHMEEDAGKLLHDPQQGTLVDLNRAGVPLIEIVTEPDFRSGEEASAYLQRLRAILLCAGVSDCKMNEGSFRCDVNLSLRRPGEPLGQRTEIKNLNSFQSVERAIAAEAARQAALLLAGKPIPGETCRFDQKTGCTYPMRRKEDSADYRFLPDPDLPEISLSQTEIEDIRRTLPPLPDARQAELLRDYGLSPYAAQQITAEPWLTDYFLCVAKAARHPVPAANLLIGEAFAQMALREPSSQERTEASLPIAPIHFARLSDMATQGRINSSTAKKILAVLFDQDQCPEAYAKAHNLFLITDEAALRNVTRQVLAAHPAMADAYLAGKTNIEKALMGKAMGLTRGLADPVRLREVLLEELSGEGMKDGEGR